MPLRLGSKNIKDVYLGDKKISKIYLGDKLVYQSTKSFILKEYKVIDFFGDTVSVEELENCYEDMRQYNAIIKDNKVYVLKNNEYVLYSIFWRPSQPVDYLKIIEAPNNVGICVFDGPEGWVNATVFVVKS